jgi:hypothetical protein
VTAGELRGGKRYGVTPGPQAAQLSRKETKMEKLADEIVEYLFTNGAGEQAHRLVLQLLDGSNGGGWCREAVKSVIISKLKALDISDDSV